MQGIARWSSPVSFLVVLVIISCGKPGFGCVESERQALLHFKDGLVDVYGRLSSWGDDVHNRNCCNWRGVECSSSSSNQQSGGHVIMLHLTAPPSDEEGNGGGSTGSCYYYQCLRGEISPSLLQLEHLTHLDLSHNDFEGRQIPPFLGSLTTIRHLNLSYANFGQIVPTQLGNLSNLLSLDLSHNFDLGLGDLEWISQFPSLRHLDLSSLDLSEATHWFDEIDKLPSLSHLLLYRCSLPPVTPSPSHGNISFVPPLVFIDLSDNDRITSSIFPWLFNFGGTLLHLDLSFCQLKGSIPNAFGNVMSSLEFLALSNNLLDGEIPETFKHMGSIAHLDLSHNRLGGLIHFSLIGEMALISYVDISSNQLQGPIPDTVGKMVSLSHLDVSSNQLQGSIPDTVGKMVLLSHLDLSSNQLQGSIPDTIGKMVSLKVLSLSDNHLQGELPESLSNLCNLETLKFEGNNLTGQLPHNLLACANTTLRTLSLSGNWFSGPVPRLVGFSLLMELHLDYNQFNGALPESIGQLADLKILDIASNSLQGIISEPHLSNLSQLYYLDLSFNSLILNMSVEWVPPFQLGTLFLTSCKLGPRFPGWLRTQKQLAQLDVSNSEISDVIPTWFWNITSRVQIFSISNNRIKGKLPDLSLVFSPFSTIDMSSNYFEGSISQLPRAVQKLDLSNNKLSGSISSFCVGQNPTLDQLDLSNNSLTGGLPSCLGEWKSLVALNLENNRFSGEIPNLFGSLQSLQTLHLRNNNLIGELPWSLKNCTSLRFIDLSKNRLSGKIPEWIGGSLLDLIVVNLGSNRLSGAISPKICQLENIQILDLSSNNLSGPIPRCLGNFTAMTKKGGSTIAYSYSPGLPTMLPGGSYLKGSYVDRGFVKWKRNEYEFKSTLGLVRSIDLSSNKLSGEIPKEVTDLLGLLSLSLARNNLTGLIPERIGRLKSLEVLDLSQNQLFGEIPTSLVEITSISVFNLSHNNLSGKIPQSTQLQTFNIDSFEGNPLLCGLPLETKCPGDEEKEDSPAHDSIEDKIQHHGKDIGLYVSIILGFIVGFWGVCGTLLLKSSWRFAFFQFLNKMKDWVDVIVAINIAKLQRSFRS